MEQAIDINSKSEEEEEDEEESEEESQKDANAIEGDAMQIDSIDPAILQAPETSSAQPPKPTVSSNLPRANGSEITNPPQTTAATSQLNTKSGGIQDARLSMASSTKSGKDPAKAMAEAQANRKAKMAALDWMEHDSESLDDAWSEEEQSEPAPSPQKQQQLQIPQQTTSDVGAGEGPVSSSGSTSVSPVHATAPPKTVLTSTLSKATTTNPPVAIGGRQSLPASM
jgi:hypothetical protein